MIEPVPERDHRGHFTRVFSTEEFLKQGLSAEVDQCSVSYNERALTLRGMHFQKAPFAEAKLVRCSKGRLFDVVVDLRPDSPTYCSWYGIELTENNWLMMFIPEGCGHGFLTLQQGTEVAYQISQPYRPEGAAGVRWDDPAFAIEWPARPEVISDRDLSFPDFRP